MTVSIGVVSLSSQINTSQKLVTAADAALYRAKQEGRNRAIVSETSMAKLPKLP